MKKDGITLNSRGIERVYLYGEEIRRTVYEVPNEWRFFIKINNEFIEVYHGSCYFTTSKIDY